MVGVKTRSHAAIWRYDNLRKGFVELIEKIVETESANRVLATPELLENSVTQAVLNEISTMMPLLALTTCAQSDGGKSDVQNYTQLMLELCTTIAHTANSPEMHSACFQILVSGLDGESPPLILLDKLVDLALAEGEERQKEVNRILTGLLMNYKLSNVGVAAQMQRSTTTSFRWCRTR